MKDERSDSAEPAAGGAVQGPVALLAGARAVALLLVRRGAPRALLELAQQLPPPRSSVRARAMAAHVRHVGLECDEEASRRQARGGKQRPRGKKGRNRARRGSGGERPYTCRSPRCNTRGACSHVTQAASHAAAAGFLPNSNRTKLSQGQCKLCKRKCQTQHTRQERKAKQAHCPA
eukprot:2651665-Rhodomonas_salina.1